MKNQIFDQGRAILLDTPDIDPLTVRGYCAFDHALANQYILPHQPVLVAHLPGANVVLPLLDMVYHHVAQGVLDDTPWMVAFCCLCNAGSIFDARLKGQRYTFAAQGYYDAMVLLADQQTCSYWNHLTGMCLSGSNAGQTLKRLGTLTPVYASEVLGAYPNALFALAAPLNDDEALTAQRWYNAYVLPSQPSLGAALLATAGETDNRLPRYDMGLGVWTPKTRRYYPISRLHANQNVIVDRLDQRGIVLILDEQVGLPTVFYCEVEKVMLQGPRVWLSERLYYEDYALFDEGMRIEPRRPNHAAIRWNGFSSIFPNCEIYGR
jgi:hypothetical protein